MSAVEDKAVEDISNILLIMGMPMEDENFQDTPKRWLKALQHYTHPYDPKDDLDKVFVDPDNNHPDVYKHGMVVQTGIPYRAMCAHHLLPVLGTAHVGYIPKDKVVGLSKLSRVVYGYSHAMPSMQEDVGNKVVDALYNVLGSRGAMCVIEAEHGCMACRGVEEAGIITATSSLRGIFIDGVAARQEFYNLVGLHTKR